MGTNRQGRRSGAPQPLSPRSFSPCAQSDRTHWSSAASVVSGSWDERSFLWNGAS